MATLTYWCCRQEDDAQCFHIREKTRKACLDQLKQLDVTWGDSAGKPVYSKPFKIEVEYEGAFDLLDQCLSEDGIFEYPLN